MKKSYLEPQLKLIALGLSDVLTLSEGQDPYDDDFYTPLGGGL